MFVFYFKCYDNRVL